jgi:hypothetical protein
VPLEVAQMRLMLSIGFAQWIKDLLPQGGGMHI